MSMQKRKFTREMMSNMIRDLINWANETNKTDDELFEMADVYLNLPSEERVSAMKAWKKGKKFTYRFMVSFKGIKSIRDDEFVKDVKSVISDLKGWWRNAPENGEMDFFTRFLKCINDGDVCELREEVKTSVKRTVFNRNK